MAVSRTEGLGLMSCVRESSPPDPTDQEDTHHEPKKRRFRPLRGLRRMFRRKERRSDCPQTVTVSADELSAGQEVQGRPATATAEDNRRSSVGLHSGLSLSHDSVFSPEQRSGQESGSELETSSSLSMQRLLHTTSGVQAELVDAVRRRRARDDTSDEEDLGLPRSPPSNSPTAADHLDKVLKENVNKSCHSTCSDGSLLSMGSSEMDEDSYGQSSGHGSKVSLHERKPDTEVEVTSAPLSHSAARHKMAIKPKRTHGVPRKRRSTQLGEVTPLPVTPEVNEDSSSILTAVNRSISPDLPGPTLSGTASVAQLKSASLPPGVVAPAPGPARLSRSRSTATPKSLDTPSEQEEAEVHSSFFGRLLSRRSGKKKKVVDEPSLDLPQKRMDEKGRYTHEVVKFNKHHPAARQRVEPINLSQERVSRMQVFYPPSPTPPDSPPPGLKDSEEESLLEDKTILRKVIPLEVDPSIPKRTFVKKSQSFRRDEALPFVSLDTPSLPVGLGELQKDETEDLNEFTTLEVIDHHLSSEMMQECEKVTVNSVKKTSSCDVTVTAEDVTDHRTELAVRKSLSLDSFHGCEPELSRKMSTSPDSFSHQITIPVGTSVVSVTPPFAEPQSTTIPHNIKPEPRKSLRDNNKEVPNFYPVPAPRPSKRDSLEAKPPKVPEFLRVQLNHVDSKPTVNVVLSTMSVVEDKSTQICDESDEDKNNCPTRKISQSDEIDVKEEDLSKVVTEESDNVLEVCVAKEPVDPNQIKFLNSVKQWTASPYALSNPNYSFVSIAPKMADTKKPENVNGFSNQSLQKSLIITDVKEKSPPLVDHNKEVSPMKAILRQRSFVSEDQPLNIMNIDKPSKVEDSKPVPLKRPSLKDAFIPVIDKSRKLSLERLDSKNQENISDFSKRRSREMSSSEENIVDRNSYGSSDTLASQDSGEVVLRRKSLSREMSKQRDEEPELLKVFARRSLKVKDSEVPEEIEALSYAPMKSRDSDKENECGDSPPEERKKIKDHYGESKSFEKVAVPNVAFKYQRSVSSVNEETLPISVLSNSKKDNGAFEKRQRSRTIPDPKIIDPPSSIIPLKMMTSIYKEKEIEVIDLERPEELKVEVEENVPRFKRIQQRKEEWEKRAQLAMKNNHQ